jgi:hypothetical protein
MTQILVKFLLSSLETLTVPILKKAATEFLLWLSFAVIGGFLPVYTVYMLQPASGTTLRVTEGYLKAGSGFLKRVSGRIFIIIKLFQISKQQLYFKFQPQKSSRILCKPSEVM